MVRSRRPDRPIKFAACSGAFIDDVVGTEQYPGDTPGGQITAVPASGALLTIVIGGNHAGFGPVLIKCAIPGAPGRKIQQQKPRLVAVYKALGRAASQARVLVLTYPQIFREGGDHYREESGINRAERS